MAELVRRKQLLRDLTAWVRKCGWEPALHHKLLIAELQSLALTGKTTKGLNRLMVLMPPGSAKSTYTSKTFPPWFLAQRPGLTILAASYSYTLAEAFGRVARNYADLNPDWLFYRLKKDSKSAGEWETTNGGRYFCAGVGAGLAGHRADLGLIDDPLGSEEDANSKLVRDKQWDWYWNDFLPRLKPDSPVILINNRRHEEDLAGRLLETEPDKWHVLSCPLVAEENDSLGRKPGDLLWPEYFNQSILDIASRNPRTFAGLYQQRPAPEDGDFFKDGWFNEYEQAELPAESELRFYTASDHACSDNGSANRTCLLTGGFDGRGVLWILPDLFWRTANTKEVAEAMLAMNQRRRPLVWWAEKGMISKSIGPFLRDLMQEQQNYINIEEVVPMKAKEVRAQSIRGRMAMGMVRFPRFATWWPNAKHELLSFPRGKNDDLVDALAHLGMGIDRMTAPSRRKPEPDVPSDQSFKPTLRWLKDSAKKKERFAQLGQLDR